MKKQLEFELKKKVSAYLRVKYPDVFFMSDKRPGSVSGGIARMLDYTLVVDPDSKNLKKN